jgi:tetratricopeptide (TPR) repeat protein
MTRMAWLPLLALVLAYGCAHAPPSELEQRAGVVQRASEPQLLVEQARAFASVGDYARAEQYSSLALEQGAHEEEVLPLLLQTCVRDQRYRDAVRYLQDYLRRRPASHQLRFVLATLHAALGDVVAARDELERSLSRAPDNAEAHYTLAVLLRDGSSDFAGADSHFREYLRLSPGGAHAEEASESLLRRVP